MKKQLWAIISILIFGSCNDIETYPTNIQNKVTVKSNIITGYYIGNGVQWGGYDIIEAWTGNQAHTQDDWNTLFNRVRFMRPPLVRIMVNKNWNYMVNGAYDPSKSESVLVPILNFCEQEGIAVIIGEWGHTGGNAIDREWLGNAVNFLEWLLKTKNYSCIKYFNMVNEPNGDWSSVKGNYTLWKQLMEEFTAKLTVKGIVTKVKLIGPDIAIWNTDQTDWITNTRFDLGNLIGTYDIHTYPSETEVRNGSYQTMIKTYMNLIPDSGNMIMSEFGYKYKSGSALYVENNRRIANDPYASDDSNMMIYDAFYGVDVADAIMQNMLAGFAGMIIWDLDDAMYNIDGSSGTLLKRWGFWNILGTEKFGNADDENIRPWFYPVSLMCRYFPEGTEIHETTLPPKKGLRTVAGEKNGKYTLAIVNSGNVSYSIDLAFEERVIINAAKIYSYIAGTGKEFTGDIDEDGFAVPFQSDTTLDFSNGNRISLSIPARSFRLYTNMD